MRCAGLAFLSTARSERQGPEGKVLITPSSAWDHGTLHGIDFAITHVSCTSSPMQRNLPATSSLVPRSTFVRLQKRCPSLSWRGLACSSPHACPFRLGVDQAAYTPPLASFHPALFPTCQRNAPAESSTEVLALQHKPVRNAPVHVCALHVGDPRVAYNCEHTCKCGFRGLEFLALFPASLS